VISSGTERASRPEVEVEELVCFSEAGKGGTGIRVWWNERCFFTDLVSSAEGRLGGVLFPTVRFGMFWIEIAFFKERVGLNSWRLLEGFDVDS